MQMSAVARGNKSWKYIGLIKQIESEVILINVSFEDSSFLGSRLIIYIKSVSKERIKWRELRSAKGVFISLSLAFLNGSINGM